MVTSILLMGLLAMTSTSVTVHSLREADRERRIATAALDSVIEDCKRIADQMVGTDPTWSENFFASYSPGGNPGPEYPAQGLEPRQGENAVVTVTVVTDETLTDAEIGATLGMPRDLDSDGVVSNTNVIGTATMLPVIIRVRWAGSAGNREIIQGFYVLGI